MLVKCICYICKDWVPVMYSRPDADLKFACLWWPGHACCMGRTAPGRSSCWWAKCKVNWKRSWIWFPCPGLNALPFADTKWHKPPEKLSVIAWGRLKMIWLSGPLDCISWASENHHFAEEFRSFGVRGTVTIVYYRCCQVTCLLCRCFPLNYCET